MRLHDVEDEGGSGPEDDDANEPKDADEVIILQEVKILEEVNSGESGAVVANREEYFGRNLAQNNKKRKQPEITDFFAKKHICKK